MTFILREFRDEEGTHYLVYRVETACCKDSYLIRVDGPKNYYWIDRLEKCSGYLTQDIELALKDWRKKGNVEP